MICDDCIHDYECARYTVERPDVRIHFAYINDAVGAYKYGDLVAYKDAYFGVEAIAAALNAADTSDPDCSRCLYVYEKKQRYTVDRPDGCDFIYIVDADGRWGSQSLVAYNSAADNAELIIAALNAYEDKS